MLRNRLMATTVHYMMPPEGTEGGGGGGGTSGVGDGAAGGGAPSGAVADSAAAASASTDAAAAAQSSDSTQGGESVTSQSTPSLLSSAAGKTPDQPAPAADATPEAKAADSSESSPKDGKESAKPDDPGKTEGKPDPAKPDEAKADAATDPAKDATATPPPAPLSIDDLKLPEGASLEAEGGKAFVDILNNAELSGKDRGQQLIDLHQKEITRVATDMAKHQRDFWDNLNNGWKDQLRKDPELGGNRLDTSLSTAKAVVEEFLSPEDAKALLLHTDVNGMGNFPPFIRLLHGIGKKMNVFEDSIVPSNAKAPKMARGPGNRGWYD